MMLVRLSGRRGGQLLAKAVVGSSGKHAPSGRSKNDYDVVIVGAGMVGSALASSLNSTPLTSSLKVAILDAKIPPKQATGHREGIAEMRVSTLTPATVALLKRCGAWQSLSPPNSAPIQHMQVWDYGSAGYLRWSARQVGHENMGHVAENSLIQAALIETLEGHQNIDCFFGTSIDSISFPSAFSNELVRIRLADDVLTTRLIVGADGASSLVRKLAGLTTMAFDYNQRGVVATVDVSYESPTAWQRFLPTGPFALLPVRHGYSNIVWSTTEEVARATESASESAAVDAFNEALHGDSKTPHHNSTSNLDAFQQPPKITGISGDKPKSFPLKRQLADSFVGSRLALVGDAYRVIHPLAGQGVNLGFADVEQLQNVLEDALRCGQDIGDRRMLEKYERRRRFENTVMMSALDAIREAFKIQAPPFQLIRRVGLEALNFAKPIKNEVMLYAMGLKPVSDHFIFSFPKSQFL